MDVTTLTDKELSDLYEAVRTETERRAFIANAPAMVNEINQRVLTYKGVKQGEEWAQPTGAHDAYSEGWEVAYDGKTWISLINGNVWEPGTSGWREKVEDGYASWIQPTGAHDAYSEGDRVMHLGKLWINVHPGERTNVWEPGVYGWKIDE